MAWRFATKPTNLSPAFVNATTDGVVLPPSAFGITTESPPTMTATQEFVVPRSMPIVFPISITSLSNAYFGNFRSLSGQEEHDKRADSPRLLLTGRVTETRVQFMSMGISLVLASPTFGSLISSTPSLNDAFALLESTLLLRLNVLSNVP